MVRKLAVGFYSFCGSGANTKVVCELLVQDPLKYQSLLEIVHAPAFQTHSENKPLDVAFIEGCIATEHQKKELQTIRKNAKKIILLGTDTMSGHPHHQRNHLPFDSFSNFEQTFIEKNQLARIQTPSEVVLIDGQMAGSPIDPVQLEKSIEHWCVEWGILEKKEGIRK